MWWGLDTTFTKIGYSRNAEDLDHWRKCFEYQNIPYHQSLMENTVLPLECVMLSCPHIGCESPPATQLYLYVTHARTALYSRCRYNTERHIWVSKRGHLHYLGPPFPIISMSQLLRAEVSPHPYPKTHWIFWLKTSTISFRGGNTHTHTHTHTHIHSTLWQLKCIFAS